MHGDVCPQGKVPVTGTVQSSLWENHVDSCMLAAFIVG